MNPLHRCPARSSRASSRRPRSLRAALIAAAVAATTLPAAALEAVPVVRGLVEPWSLAFLPEGRMLVTERAGRLRVVAPDGRLSPPVAMVHQHRCQLRPLHEYFLML
jgi:glucose/arabinose dehydrogenase